MKVALAAAALLVGVVAFGAPSQAASILVNGSFESPDLPVPGGFLFDIGVGDSSLTGWTVTTGSVDLVTDTCCGPLLADTGNQFIDLVGSNFNGGIAQQFATVANQTYTLSFAYSHNPGFFSASALVTLMDDVNASSLLSQTITSSTGPWIHFVAQFVATSDLTTLAFTNTAGGSNQGVFLDSVSVAVATTPLPAALPLFASALGGLGFVGWRRRRPAA